MNTSTTNNVTKKTEFINFARNLFGITEETDDGEKTLILWDILKEIREESFKMKIAQALTLDEVLNLAIEAYTTEGAEQALNESLWEGHKPSVTLEDNEVVIKVVWVVKTKLPAELAALLEGEEELLLNGTQSISYEVFKTFIIPEDENTLS